MRMSDASSSVMVSGAPSVNQSSFGLHAFGADGRDVAETFAGLRAGLGLREAARFESRLTHGEVKRDFVVDIAVDARDAAWQSKQAPHATHGQAPTSAVGARSALAMASTYWCQTEP